MELYVLYITILMYIFHQQFGCYQADAYTTNISFRKILLVAAWALVVCVFHIVWHKMSLNCSRIKITKWTSLPFYIVECYEQMSLLLRTT